MSAAAAAEFWGVTLGAGAVRRLARGELDGAAFVAWSWLVGTLGVGMLAWAWIALAIPLQFLPTGAGAFALLVLAVGFTRRPRAPAVESSPRPRMPLLVAVAALVVLGLAADDVVSADATPVMMGDENNIFASRAKALFVAGAIDDDYQRFVNEGQFVGHPEYPILNPLLQVWTFVNAGEVTFVANRFVIQCFLLAMLLLAASECSRAARPWIAVFVLLALAGSHLVRTPTRYGDGDSMVAFGVLAAAGAARRLRAAPSAARGLLLALALAFLVTSKNEGKMFAAVIVAITLPGLIARRRVGTLASLAIPASLWIAHAAWNARFSFATDLFSVRGGRTFFDRVVANGGVVARIVGRALYEMCVASPLETCGLVLALAALLFVAPRAFLRERGPELATIGLALAAFVVIFLGTPLNAEWHVATALPRLVYQFLPLVAVCVAAALESTLPRRARDAGAAAATRVEPGPA